MSNWRFGAFPKLPYSTMQQLNLDWILDRIRRFLPDTGTIGQVLTRTKDGAAWQDAAAGGGAVNSVNGQTGDVVLDAEDVGALPDTYTAPVTSVNEQTGDVDIDTGVMSIEFVRQDGQTGTIKMADSFVIRSLEGIAISANTNRTIMLISANKSTIGLSHVDNVRQYSASNPPPYPVTSVNGQTGAVVIPAGGAVNSVNGQTGTVVLDADDVGALPDTYVAPVTSVNGQTGDVVVQAGGITMHALWTNDSPTSSFAGQTINVDLSSYSWFAVKYRFGITSGTQDDQPLAVFSVDEQSKRLLIAASGNNRTGGRLLNYDATAKTITFGNGQYNGATANANAIPVTIYGIGGIS